MIALTLILRAAPGPPLALCVFGMALGIYGFYQGFLLLQRRRVILDTPVSKIRSASMGLVELSGLAVGPFTLTAPVTARPCYYYRTLVWELRQEGKNRKWVKVAAECMHVPFFLDDNTGKVMVDPRGAELDLHRDFQQEFCDSVFTFKEPIPPNVHMLLSRHGVNITNRVKVEEFCIKPKNALFILGTLAENPGLELSAQPIHDDEHNTLAVGKSLWAGSDDGASLHFSFPLASTAFPHEERSIGQRLSASIGRQENREELPLGNLAFDESALLKAFNPVHPLAAKPSQPSASTRATAVTDPAVLAATLLKAGITNPAAWATAGLAQVGRAEATVPTATPAISPEAFETNPRTVLTKGQKNSTFLISWRSQRDVATSLGWKCALFIWGGPGLALVSLYGLLAITHTI
jgi:hypothetical protein